MADVDKSQLQKLGDRLDELVPDVLVLNSTGSVGMKFDGGKLLANILFEDFPFALEGVLEIATFGAKKYARSSWHSVPDALQRYSDAMVRHQIAIGKGEIYDPESGLLHRAHFAWNALAVLELIIRAGTFVRVSPKVAGVINNVGAATSTS